MQNQQVRTFKVNDEYKEAWFEECKKMYNNKYDYVHVDLENRSLEGKVKIICPDHGEFWQNPVRHRAGSKCKQCSSVENAKKSMMTLSTFIKRSKANQNHINRNYDYSKITELPLGSETKVTIICPIHKEFIQKAISHATLGFGCAQCNIANNASKNSQNYKNKFIEKCLIKYGNIYNYDTIDYVNNNMHIKIQCRVHNSFFNVTPKNHLDGSRCDECIKNFKNNKKMTNDQFVERVIKLDKDNRYDLAKTVFNDKTKELTILCKKHGEFKATPALILSGEQIGELYGCPKC